MAKIQTIFSALRELGPLQMGLYAGYRVLLHTGYLRMQTPGAGTAPSDAEITPLSLPFFDIQARESLLERLGKAGENQLAAEAEEICAGQVRLFGGPPVPLQLIPPGPLKHWTDYERGRQPWGVEDVKWIWEPARFGWAYTLARAGYVTGDDRYAQAFWKHTEAFLDANPPNLGPNWASAQEVALRLIAFAFCGQLLSTFPSSHPGRMKRLAAAIAAHAGRIPVTILYARAQNNNHLLTEAAGLYTAAVALPGHPQASRWRKLGWRWFHTGLQQQIDPDGSYMQHSVNYHRLMLQISLWMQLLAQGRNQKMPERSLQRLVQAVLWLQRLVDPASGQVPNLGPNDGAYILPLTLRSFSDYQPVLQTAGMVFLGRSLVENSDREEMAAWLGGASGGTRKPGAENREPSAARAVQGDSTLSPAVLRNPQFDTWAYLRAAKFHSRPGHADQLHLDLWWQGHNIALDPGTYLYNAPPPWDNALSRTAVHNTVTVNGKDQMARAGRFLYLDWAQARVLAHEKAGDGSWERITVEQNGYRRLGLTHRRSVTWRGNEWVIEDQLLPGRQGSAEPYRLDLHWLLPDQEWEVEREGPGIVLQVFFPDGKIGLQFERDCSGANQPLSLPGDVLQESPGIQIIRGGKLLFGEGAVPETWGWVSSTYGYKTPALSVHVTLRGPAPLCLRSRWSLPPIQEGAEK